MSLISYNQLKELVKARIVTDVPEENINAASIDLTLGSLILVEATTHNDIDRSLQRVSLKGREPLKMREYDLERDGSFILFPGEFILAHTAQKFYLPRNIAAEYKLKSSMARIGLEHLNAGFCDPGWNGSVLTLELKNMTRSHEILLSAGDKIGQIVFFECEYVPEEASYAARGRYNNDVVVSGVKK